LPSARDSVLLQRVDALAGAGEGLKGGPGRRDVLATRRAKKGGWAKAEVEDAKPVQACAALQARRRLWRRIGEESSGGGERERCASHRDAAEREVRRAHNTIGSEDLRVEIYNVSRSIGPTIDRSLKSSRTCNAHRYDDEGETQWITVTPRQVGSLITRCPTIRCDASLAAGIR